MRRQNRRCPPATFLGLGGQALPLVGAGLAGRPALGQVSPVPGTASLSVAFPRTSQLGERTRHGSFRGDLPGQPGGAGPGG